MDGTHLRKIEVFLRDTGMAPTKFGRLCAKDPRLVLDMRNGRQPSARMKSKIDAYIAQGA